jgi:lipopolysaccharide/colanic/teichoic acid biosynthesis glycosyltransferase
MKRGFDFLIALAALLVLAPLLLVLALLVRIKLGAPVLFCQPRPGRHGEVFVLWKFRTMTDARDASGKLRTDEERLTPFGRMLRATSLDELPELWNVLRGEMSLVGPRPLLVEYLPRYSAEQARRHEVRPGLTGWAQVNGRNATTWDERLRLDVWYVDHASFLLDLRILWRTVGLVFRREGVSAPGTATMPEFRPPSHNCNMENNRHADDRTDSPTS